jgi:hypothetical protein
VYTYTCTNIYIYICINTYIYIKPGAVVEGAEEGGAAPIAVPVASGDLKAVIDELESQMKELGSVKGASSVGLIDQEGEEEEEGI